ncbi:MAG: methyltransferase [Bacteroidetes bacterium]|nr:methyltransferase [Bacteroidota bacterium]
MSSFQFKNFSLQQTNTAQRIGTDSVLFGAWVDLCGAKKVLDVGSGSGILSLMAAQRFPNICIDALEPDPGSLTDAKANATASPWADSIQLFDEKLQVFYPGRKYDHIISNPPFFSGGLRHSAKAKANARHTDRLPFEELISNVDRLLADDGKFSLILSIQEVNRFKELIPNRVEAPFLSLERECLVKPTKNKAPHRSLMTFSREAVGCKSEEITLLQSQIPNDFTEEFSRLTAEFYLNVER